MVDFHGLEGDEADLFGRPGGRALEWSVEKFTLGPRALVVGTAFHNGELVYPFAC